jgi:hypothetical protein
LFYARISLHPNINMAFKAMIASLILAGAVVAVSMPGENPREGARAENYANSTMQIVWDHGSSNEQSLSGMTTPDRRVRLIDIP